MGNLRTTGHDVMRRRPAPVRQKIGIDPPPGRVGVYDTKGQRRGHVGPHAGVSVATRLLGGAPAEAGKVKGKPAWIATRPRIMPRVLAPNAKLAKQLRTDKGSVSK
jgi:hypothetical protein